MLTGHADAPPQGGGANGAPAPGAAEEVPTAAAPAAAPLAEPARPEAAPPAAPDPVPAAAPPAAAPVDATPDAAVDPDRFGLEVSLLRTRTEAHHLGGALQVLHELRALPLDAVQTAALQAAADDFETALAAAAADVVKALVDGRVLAAAAAVHDVLTDDPGHAESVFAQALAPGGVGPGLRSLPADDGAPWPVPRALRKGRDVRVVLDGSTVRGQVVDGNAERVTLRVVDARGVTFPSLARIACEPIDPSGEEALEMAFAALHARDGVLARLWLCCANLRELPAAATERRAMLQQLLRGPVR